MAEGRAVENADAVYDELGIDISMPEEIDGASNSYIQPTVEQETAEE